MLYSIIPPEVILDDSAGALPQLREVDLGPGLRLVVRQSPAGECVDRVIATDPRHYLNPEWWPGQPYRVPRQH